MGQFAFGFVTGIASIFVIAFIYQFWFNENPYEDPEVVKFKVQEAYLRGKIEGIDWVINNCEVEDDPVEDSIEG